MTEDEFLDRIGEILYAELQEWQVDALIEVMRMAQPEWVAIGDDPMVGGVGEAPPVHTWRLN